MILILLSIILCIIFIAWLDRDLLAGILAGIPIGFFMGYLLAIFIGCLLPTYTVLKEETPIYALNNSSAIEGRAYLFSTTVDEEMVYKYIVETEKGLSIQEKKVDNCYIVETTEAPRMCYYSSVFEKDWMYLFGIPNEESYYVFYLPENSVTTEYVIDLE